MQLIQRFFTPPNRSFFLLGPRGTGKSTLMKSLFADALWLDLLKPDVLRNYLASPERLYDLVAGNPNQKIIVIDEVQKAPSLLTVVHDLIEQQRELCFILTGSSARKIKKAGADLLGGRALNRHLHPFMAAELGAQFSLEAALTKGLLPLATAQIDAQDILQAYVNLYLQEEIQAEGLVRNLENFTRFLEVCAFSHASLLNVTNLARECAVKRKTVENYLNILEDLLLAFRLPVFTQRAQRELVGHPKFYLFDTGIFKTLRLTGPLDSTDEINGAALEGLVAQHLRAWIDYSSEKYSLSYWRTRSGLEVDFIIYGPQGLWAIEVKNSKQISPQDFKGLKAFREDYPVAQGILLYRGEECLRRDDIWCIPCEQFLKKLRPDQPIPTWKHPG